MKKHLQRNEKVIADNGYGDPKCVQRRNVPQNHLRLGNTIRARHQSVKGRLKRFNVLTSNFRHDLKLHSSFFYAVANLTYLVIKHEGPL